MINVARGQYDTALVFVAILTLIGMALSLYGAVVLIEKHLLRWQDGFPGTSETLQTAAGTPTT